MNRSMIKLPIAFICIGLFAAVSGLSAVSAQDVCDVHRKAVAKLSDQAESINSQLAFAPETERLARSVLSDFNKALSNPGLRDDILERYLGPWTAHPARVKDFGLTWKSAYNTNDVLLLRALRDAQIRQVQRFVSSHAQLREQRKVIDRQLTYHRNRLAEFGCKGKLDDSKNRCDGFVGTWKTDFGEMTFETIGDSVTASYSFDSGRVRGTLSDNGRVLVGTYTESQAEGTFQFVLAPDGQSFSGTWRRTSGTRNPPNGTWSGKCIGR